MTMEWTSTYDHWLKCENGCWVRWSAVKGVKVELAPAAEDGWCVVLVQTDELRWLYQYAETKAQAENVVSALLGQLSGNYR